MSTPVKPVLGLFLLAPLVGEYLLGNVTIRDLGALVILAPLYGGGALLIREVTRRTGRGWTTVLTLGLAYGLVEAGLFDGSLFSASYEGVDYDAVRVPLLGVSAFYALQFVINHAVWSIGIPILLTETLTPRHRTAGWLGPVGFAGTGLLYLAAGLLVRYDSVRSGEYHVSAAQAAGVVLLALALIGFALTRPARVARAARGRVPRPWLTGLVALVLSAVYITLPATGLGVAGTLAVTALAAGLLVRFGRRAGWHTRHRVALAAGALATYAGAGFLVTGFKHDADPVAFAGNAVFAVAALVLVVRSRGCRPPSRCGCPGPAVCPAARPTAGRRRPAGVPGSRAGSSPGTPGSRCGWCTTRSWTARWARPRSRFICGGSGCPRRTGTSCGPGPGCGRAADLFREHLQTDAAVIETGRLLDPRGVLEHRLVPYWCESAARRQGSPLGVFVE